MSSIQRRTYYRVHGGCKKCKIFNRNFLRFREVDSKAWFKFWFEMVSRLNLSKLLSESVIFENLFENGILTSNRSIYKMSIRAMCVYEQYAHGNRQSVIWWPPEARSPTTCKCCLQRPTTSHKILVHNFRDRNRHYGGGSSNFITKMSRYFTIFGMLQY